MTLRKSVARVIAGAVVGWLALMVLSFPLSLLISRLAPGATMLSDGVLYLDFALSVLIVGLAGYVATRIGGRASTYIMAALIVASTIAAPARNWPGAAGWAYAAFAVVILYIVASLSKARVVRRGRLSGSPS